MQTPAEIHLIDAIKASLINGSASLPTILNVGAGRSTIIEDALRREHEFVVDRLDVVDCRVDHPNVRRCYQCSVEKMTPLATESYDLVFSNYVLEHVKDLKASVAKYIEC